MLMPAPIDIPNEVGLRIRGVVVKPFRDAITPCKVSFLTMRDGVADYEDLGVGPKFDRIRNRRGSPRGNGSRRRWRMGEFLVKVASSCDFRAADGYAVLFLTEILVLVGLIMAVAIVKVNVA